MLIEGNDPYRGPSFTLSHRLKRQLWNFVQAFFFSISPRPLHRWRAFLLSIFGAEIGRGCHVYPSAKIWAPWNLKLGNFVGIADGVTLYCMDRIEIGDYAVVSQGVHVCGGTHDFNSANFQLVVKPIEIGAHAWICAEAFIHPGVTVPEGAVVGARSVVTKSLEEPWKVYTGNPCREVGTRRKLTDRISYE